MSWPYLKAWDFETGTGTEIGSETDTGTQLDVAHYTELARHGYAPYRGAYCARIQFSGAATDAYFDDTDVAIATGETAYVGFALYVPSTFDHNAKKISLWTADDGGTAIADVRLTDDSGSLVFGAMHRTGGGEQITTGIAVPRDKWIWVEVDVGLDTAAANGYTTVYIVEEGSTVRQTAASETGDQTASGPVDGAFFGAEITAITGTGISGTILLDAYRYHDPADTNAALVDPVFPRFQKHAVVNVPTHLFVGPGKLEEIQMISGSDTTLNEIIVYDTDRADTDESNIVLQLSSVVASETVSGEICDVYLSRGCYVDILSSGATIGAGTNDSTNARANVRIDPRVYGSRSNVVTHGLAKGS